MKNDSEMLIKYTIRLEAKNLEFEKKLKILEKALEEIDKSNDCMKYFNNDIHEIIHETRETLRAI